MHHAVTITSVMPLLPLCCWYASGAIEVNDEVRPMRGEHHCVLLGSVSDDRVPTPCIEP
jgi:hypothetical protein